MSATFSEKCEEETTLEPPPTATPPYCDQVTTKISRKSTPQRTPSEAVFKVIVVSEMFKAELERYAPPPLPMATLRVQFIVSMVPLHNNAV